MPRIFLFSLAMFLIFGLARAAAAPVIEQGLKESPTVSILPFKNKSTIPAIFADKIALSDASIVSDFLLERLWHTGKFSIVDREDLEEMIKELEFGQSGLVNPATALSVGKQMGVKYMIKGSVENISVKNTSPADISVANKGGFKANKVTVDANIQVKFINIETGVMVLVASGKGRSSRGDAELNYIPQKYYDVSDDSAVSDISAVSVVSELPDISVDIEGASPENTGTNANNSGYRIKIGSSEVSQIQVRNALYKAVIDAVENEELGILALINGSTKKRKV